MVRSINLSNNFEHIFLKSIVMGFILKNFLSAIPFRLSYYLNIFGLIIFTIIVAYASAQISNNMHFNSFLKKIGITRSTTAYFWDDIIDKNLWVKLESQELNLDYYGLVCSVECYPRYPLIVLGNYLKRTSDGNILEDYELYPEKRVILDTSKFDTIELIYDKDSEKIKEYKRMTKEIQNSKTIN